MEKQKPLDHLAVTESERQTRVESGGHTPGPWKVWTHQRDGSVNIVNGSRSFVCEVGVLGLVDVGDGGKLDETIRADARLIAAAPDLLQTLRNIEGCYELIDAKEIARAAIAKATGAAMKFDQLYDSLRRRVEASDFCPYAKSDMTPCVIKDGECAMDSNGECVGCGRYRHSPAPETAGMPAEKEDVIRAAHGLSPWLSAALDDPSVCAEMKRAINAWFDTGMPAPNAAPQLPHGVCRADDPNEEAKGTASSRPQSQAAGADAIDPNARGVAPSASDDGAGTSIAASAAP